QGAPRSPDAEEAEGVRRPGASAPGPRAHALHHPPRRRSLRKDRTVTAPLTQTTGRRKEAIARVRVRPGTGVVTVNGKPIEQHFPTPTQRNLAIDALRI